MDCTFVDEVVVGMLEGAGFLRDGTRGVVIVGVVWVWLLVAEFSTPPFICFSWYRCNCSSFSSISGLRFSCFNAFLMAADVYNNYQNIWNKNRNIWISLILLESSSIDNIN